MSGDATVWRRNGLESLQASRTAAKAAPVGTPFFFLGWPLDHLCDRASQNAQHDCLLGFYCCTSSQSPPVLRKKIDPRQALTSTSKQPVDISHKCSVDVHQLRLRSHRYQYSPKVQRKTHLQISFRHRSKGPASYSTDLQYRGSVRLHVNATNVLFFLRTFQDERPLYRKLTTSAFQENFNDV